MNGAARSRTFAAQFPQIAGKIGENVDNLGGNSRPLWKTRVPAVDKIKGRLTTKLQWENQFLKIPTGARATVWAFGANKSSIAKMSRRT